MVCEYMAKSKEKTVKSLRFKMYVTVAPMADTPTAAPKRSERRWWCVSFHQHKISKAQKQVVAVYQSIGISSPPCVQEVKSAWSAMDPTPIVPNVA
jgi:hypothetical protein